MPRILMIFMASLGPPNERSAESRVPKIVERSNLSGLKLALTLIIRLNIYHADLIG
jgi:hypothetical protein